MKNRKEKKKADYLFVEADEDHIAEQHGVQRSQGIIRVLYRNWYMSMNASRK